MEVKNFQDVPANALMLEGAKDAFIRLLIGGPPACAMKLVKPPTAPATTPTEGGK